jgi:[protein-PII] uridylyltransferase
LAEGDDARAFVARFVRALPERYALASSAEAIAAHAAFVERHLREREPASVMLLPGGRGGAAEICVVADDRPGLLADIAAALAASRLSVHAAQIHSCALEPERPLAIDVFFVHHRAGAEAVPGAVESAERHLRGLIGGGKSAAELVRGSRREPRREREGPRVPNRVLIDNRASPEHTVVEIITRDRPGLLFELSNALYRQGLSIAVAKITTEGTRVVDVFYVSERDGKKVTDETRARELRGALEQLLENLAEDTGTHGEATL